MVATRAYEIVVTLPEIELAVASTTLPQATRMVSGLDASYSFDFKTVTERKNIEADDVRYSISPMDDDEGLPSGLSISETGILSGSTAAAEGTYNFRVTASFSNGSDESVTASEAFAIEVIDTVAIAFKGNDLPAGSKRAAYEFDLTEMIDDSGTSDVIKDQIVWTWALNPNRDPLETMADLPSGLSISDGIVTGNPVNSGKYDLILTASFDGRSFTRPAILQISLPGIALGMADGVRHLGAFDLGQGISVDLTGDVDELVNIPTSALRWSIMPGQLEAGENFATLPNGTGLDAETGRITGSAIVPGKYRFVAKATFTDENPIAEHAEASRVYTLVINEGAYQFKQIATGRLTGCGVTTGGGVLCWGNNDLGQLGNGNSATSSEPLPVTGLSSGVKSIALGQYYGCAVMVDGKVRCWGHNDSGQLGDNTRTNRYVPVEVSGLSNVSSIAASYSYTCAVTTSGGVKCWGYNGYGQLGNGSTGTSGVPVDVTGLSSGVAEVSVGPDTTCALMNDGSVQCWGRNTFYQMGIGSNTANRTTPVAVTDLGTSVKSISIGNNHTCAVMKSGGLKCWGQNYDGQVGDNTTAAKMNPVDVQGMSSGVERVSSGFEYTCAVMTGGAVKCWGSNDYGRLGDMSSSTRISPTPATSWSSHAIKDIATVRFWDADSFTCGLTEQNMALCLGRNNFQQLGNRTIPAHSYTFTPVNVGG